MLFLNLFLFTLRLCVSAVYFMTYDIAIIGAGIIGAACAYRLAAEGFKVAVIEARGIAAGATSEGMGHIVVMDDSEAQFTLTNYSQQLWHEFSGHLPASSEYEFCGTIWVAADEDEMQEVRRKKSYFEKRGVRSEILDEKALIEAEPNLRKGLPGGLLVPADSVVYQPTATQFLLADSGADFFSGKRAAAITENGVRLENSTLIPAQKVVIAAGIWSGGLLAGLQIRRKKGHLVITERSPNFVRHQLVELGYLKSAHASDRDSVAFNVQPRITEQILIGSSRQFDVENKAIDYNILRQMTNRACEYLPNLKKLSAVRVWTGFRPATPDNLPYIGRHPMLENVYLATGHEGLGITTALGTAEILTDEIVGRESKIDRKPYSPCRF
jgi:glycine/D-amino acid oxidase-like deaminating enzyme